MGHAYKGEYQHATEEEMFNFTNQYDQEGLHTLGHWSNFVVDAHTRVIVEHLGNRQYCTRSLFRSVLHFEVIEELAQRDLWLGRLYRVQGGELKLLVKSEDVGDSQFREYYRSLGGTANW